MTGQLRPLQLTAADRADATYALARETLRAAGFTEPGPAGPPGGPRFTLTTGLNGVIVTLSWTAPPEQRAVIPGAMFGTLVLAGLPAWTDGGAIHVPTAQEAPYA